MAIDVCHCSAFFGLKIKGANFFDLKVSGLKYEIKLRGYKNQKKTKESKNFPENQNKGSDKKISLFWNNAPSSYPEEKITVKTSKGSVL